MGLQEDTTASAADVGTDTVTFDYLERRLDQGVRYGVPIGISDTGAQTYPFAGEVNGQWVTITITDARNKFTATHNMNIPTTSVTGGGGTAKLPNCRWQIWGIEYGDRTGATAAPAVPGGAFAINIMKMVNGAVTANAIDLEYSITGFTPDATHPVYLTLFFIATGV